MPHSVSIDDILCCPQLPSPPSVAIRLLELCNSPDAGVREIVQAVQTDPALSTKILRSANSSFVGARKEIRSVQHAVSMLGTRVIASIALTFSLDSRSLKQDRLADQYSTYWRRSTVQASAAECLAREIGGTAAGELFTAGLLMDIGRLALLTVAPAEYVSLLDECGPGESPTTELERTRLGFDHTELGERLLALWKLPDWLQEVARHHESDPGELDPEVASNKRVHCLLMASRVGDFVCTPPSQEAALKLQTVAESLFGFDDTLLFKYLDRTSEHAASAAVMLETDADSLPSAAELMASAQECQIQMAMKQDEARRRAEAGELEAQLERTMLEAQLN